MQIGGDAAVEREAKLLALSRAQLESLAGLGTLAGLALRRADERVQTDTYLDTADRRLFRAGLSLRRREKPSGTVATLKQVPAAGDRPLLAERSELETPFEDLGTDPFARPGGEIGRRVLPLMGPLALQPLVVVRTRRTVFDLTGPEDAVLAELSLDRAEVFREEDAGPAGAFDEAEVEDRGGGPAVVEAAARECIERLGFLPSTLSKLERALAAVGLLPQVRGEEREFDLAVRPTDRLVDAAYRAFRKHFERMKRNEAGTRVGDDPEFLHDMRVSTRRLRAAFRTFRGAVRESRVAAFGKSLKWVAAVLGDVRDLDVYLERLPEYAKLLPEEDREALAPFRDHLEREREKARARMLRALETRRYAGFLERFEAFLLRGAPARPALPAARERVTAAAPRRIRKALRRALRQGRAIPEDPPAADLHALRITMKRLRYACEFFADLYGKPMKQFIRSVVELQDLLGAHQDACVAGATLRDFALRHPSNRGRQGLSAVLALGQLVAAQERAAAEARAGFRRAFDHFDRKKLRRALHAEMGLVTTFVSQ